ncbi:hypothetical protein C2G38_2156445 [Gigaspora rosea]|uniref:Uncharacterized protein n=1 Tax=Gigaspora rosea TaxID=44941 RepID=A0A397W2K5_9GLOM|nr:hypothetical protein C2G38_2156445 [Gigaspora rosea]
MNPETHEQKKFLRSITKDYIDLQDSNQENNAVEQILSKEELNIKLQRLLDQIKIQIQTLQGQLTLEEAYKNHEYIFLFKRATTIYKVINSSKLEVIIQRKYLSQIRKLVEFYIKESNLTEYCNLKLEELIALEQGETQNDKELNLAVKLATLLALFKLLASTYDKDYISSSLVKESIFRYLNTLQPTDPLRKESEDLINNLSGNTANRYNQLSEIEKAYLNRALLALEGARNIQENDQITPIIFQNTGLTQATQDYLLQHHTQLVLETTTTRRNPRTNNLEIIGTPLITEAIGIILQTAFEQYTNYKSEIVKELSILETPRLKEYYKIALISISVNQGILEERIKEISIQNIEGEIVDKITETLLYINNTKSNPLNAKSIAREFYPHVLEYDKQRPNKIPAHILTRTQTLFPELTGRALVKEQEKQRNIYNNFLDNTQAQIEEIKKRLLAESPEFCKIFEDNPETGETEFYYGDYNNQFTILPFRFHHLILHHLEAINNILYSEGARNKIHFEEEESYISAYSEINKLSQEFIDQTKKVKKLKEEKERLEQATDKIINKILSKDEPSEKPKRTRSNSL